MLKPKSLYKYTPAVQTLNQEDEHEPVRTEQDEKKNQGGGAHKSFDDDLLKEAIDWESIPPGILNVIITSRIWRRKKRCRPEETRNGGGRDE